MDSLPRVPFAYKTSRIQNVPAMVEETVHQHTPITPATLKAAQVHKEITWNLKLNGTNPDAIKDEEMLRADGEVAALDIICARHYYPDLLPDNARIADTLANINGNLTAMNGNLTAMNGNLATINTRLDNMETDVTQLRADVTQVQTDVAQLRADVTQVQADVAQLRADVTHVQTDVAQMRITQDATNVQLTRVERNVAVNAAQIENLHIIRWNARDAISTYRLLHKVHEGNGNAHAVKPPSVNMPNLHAGNPGDICPGFPGREVTPTEMTNADILQLIHFYNPPHGLGIALGTSLKDRRTRVIAWLTGRD